VDRLQSEFHGESFVAGFPTNATSSCGNLHVESEGRQSGEISQPDYPVIKVQVFSPQVKRLSISHSSGEKGGPSAFFSLSGENGICCIPTP
jgi:hypothetical protein